MRKSTKWLLSLIPLVLIALIGTCIYLIPTFLSSQTGIKLIEDTLSKKIGSKVEIESLNLHWGGNQQVHKIKIHGKTEKIVIDTFSFDCPLLSLIFAPPSPIEMLLCGPLNITGITFTRGAEEIYIPAINGKAIDNNDFLITLKTKIGKKHGTLTAKINLQNNPIWDITFDSIPSQLLTFLNPNIPIEYIIGPACSGECFLRMNETSMEWKLKLAGAYLKMSGSGILSDTLQLITPLQVDFILTKELSAKIFTGTSVRPISAKAIHLHIDPEGVSIPLNPFSLDKLNIPKLHLDLGKIDCQNFGTLTTLLSIIQLRPRFSNDVMVWFQDTTIRIQNGICHIPRTEVLVDNLYEIGLYGDVDLVNKTVQGSIALTASLLQKGFGLKNLAHDYTLVLKVDGPFNDIYIHKSKALRKIAQLALLDQTPLRLLPKGSQAPPPRRPFPWRSS